MPALSNPKHEAFAVIYAQGQLSLTEAAKRAGYSGNAHNVSSRLARRPDVAARLHELQNSNPNGFTHAKEEWPGAKFVTEPYVVGELVSVHQRARVAKQYAVCVTCLRTLGEIGGFVGYAQRGPKNVNTTNNIAMLDRGQLDTILKRELGGLDPSERRKLLADAPELAHYAEDVKAVDVTPEAGLPDESSSEITP